jgi:hypothetical protein
MAARYFSIVGLQSGRTSAWDNMSAKIHPSCYGIIAGQSTLDWIPVAVAQCDKAGKETSSLGSGRDRQLRRFVSVLRMYSKPAFYFDQNAFYRKKESSSIIEPNRQTGRPRRGSLIRQASHQDQATHWDHVAACLHPDDLTGPLYLCSTLPSCPLSSASPCQASLPQRVCTHGCSSLADTSSSLPTQKQVCVR